MSAARDLGELEGDLRAAALGFAAKAPAAIMSGPLQQAAGVDAPAGRRGTRTTTILSSVGDVSYTRARVPGDGQQTSFPADEALGLVCRCTPTAAKLLCHEAARSQSYLQTSDNLAMAAGIAGSSSSIHRLVRAVGPDMEAWALARRAGARYRRLPADGHDRRADAAPVPRRGQGHGRGAQGPADQVRDALPDGAGQRGDVPPARRQHRACDLLLRPRVVLSATL